MHSSAMDKVEVPDRGFVDAHGMHRLPSRTQWSVASPFRFLSTNKVMRRALRDQWLDSRRNY